MSCCESAMRRGVIVFLALNRERPQPCSESTTRRGVACREFGLVSCRLELGLPLLLPLNCSITWRDGEEKTGFGVVSCE
ncbi:hypothetical protein C2S52_011474 [Perilla frutescens var. hirtella]|nr:hypothetical protein C2S52_011474 [Perilla frutescens var. hirtella]